MAILNVANKIKEASNYAAVYFIILPLWYLAYHSPSRNVSMSTMRNHNFICSWNCNVVFAATVYHSYPSEIVFTVAHSLSIDSPHINSLLILVSTAPNGQECKFWSFQANLCAKQPQSNWVWPRLKDEFFLEMNVIIKYSSLAISVTFTRLCTRHLWDEKIF